ncbi:MAG: universal stress protein [Candidatus Helarchaeota archaeon]
MKVKIFDNILILTDGSEYSLKLAEYGIKLAIMNDARLSCLYVVDMDNISKICIKQNISTDQIEEKFEKQGEKAITSIRKIAEKYNMEINTFIKKGKIVDEILKFIIQNKIDLVCITHRIRKGSESFRLISIANQIIEFANCPVFVLQHK